jgi:hypothetical protein
MDPERQNQPTTNREGRTGGNPSAATPATDGATPATSGATPATNGFKAADIWNDQAFQTSLSNRKYYIPANQITRLKHYFDQYDAGVFSPRYGTKTPPSVEDLIAKLPDRLDWSDVSGTDETDRDAKIIELIKTTASRLGLGTTAATDTATTDAGGGDKVAEIVKSILAGGWPKDTEKGWPNRRAALPTKLPQYPTVTDEEWQQVIDTINKGAAEKPAEEKATTTEEDANRAAQAVVKAPPADNSHYDEGFRELYKRLGPTQQKNWKDWFNRCIEAGDGPTGKGVAFGFEYLVRRRDLENGGSGWADWIKYIRGDQTFDFSDWGGTSAASGTSSQETGIAGKMGLSGSVTFDRAKLAPILNKLPGKRVGETNYTWDTKDVEAVYAASEKHPDGNIQAIIKDINFKGAFDKERAKSLEMRSILMGLSEGTTPQEQPAAGGGETPTENPDPDINGFNPISLGSLLKNRFGFNKTPTLNVDNPEVNAAVNTETPAPGLEATDAATNTNSITNTNTNTNANTNTNPNPVSGYAPGEQRTPTGRITNPEVKEARQAAKEQFNGKAKNIRESSNGDTMELEFEDSKYRYNRQTGEWVQSAADGGYVEGNKKSAIKEGLRFGGRFS